MEWQEVINFGMSIWVTEISLLTYSSKKTLMVNGVPIDGSHGFGSEDKKGYSGKAILLSPKHRNIQYLTIDRIHTTKNGWGWGIETTTSLPNPPFLISSDISKKIIFDGLIQLIDKQDVIDISEADNYPYAVASKNYFGIITVKKNQQIHLIAFSSEQDATVSENDEIWTFEWDCSIGKIKPIVKSLV
jgi:hypothetical protein